MANLTPIKWYIYIYRLIELYIYNEINVWLGSIGNLLWYNNDRGVIEANKQTRSRQELIWQGTCNCLYLIAPPTLGFICCRCSLGRQALPSSQYRQLLHPKEDRYVICLLGGLPSLIFFRFFMRDELVEDGAPLRKGRQGGPRGAAALAGEVLDLQGHGGSRSRRKTGPTASKPQVECLWCRSLCVQTSHEGSPVPEAGLLWQATSSYSKELRINLVSWIIWCLPTPIVVPFRCLIKRKGLCKYNHEWRQKSNEECSWRRPNQCISINGQKDQRSKHDHVNE